MAISFAEEDSQVAQSISEALKKEGIRPYFYKDEQAEQWGENLFNIVMNRYKETARFALIMVSKNYKKKWWTRIELQIIQTVLQRGGTSYLLPLRLDDTRLDGLTNNILFVNWKNNPEEIATLLKKKLATSQKVASEQVVPVSTSKMFADKVHQKAEEIFNVDKVTGGITINKTKQS